MVGLRSEASTDGGLVFSLIDNGSTETVARKDVKAVFFVLAGSARITTLFLGGFVHSTLRTLSIVAIVATAGGPLCSAPAFARTATIAADAHAQTIAQSSHGQSSITGTVTSAGGQRLGNATVSASGPIKTTVHTDANGAFTIAGPPGLYTLVVSHGGYTRASTEIATASGEKTTANVSLAEASLATPPTLGRTRAPLHI